MKKYRIYVEKKESFNTEAVSLLNDFNINLNLEIENLRLINIYDVFNIESELLKKSKEHIFTESVTDVLLDEIDVSNKHYIAVEYLPGQYDQRADSAMQCISLIDPSSDATIKSAKLVIIDGDLTCDDLTKIKKYFINEVESREKDLSILDLSEKIIIKPVEILQGFREKSLEELTNFRKSYGLAMTLNDLVHIKSYFKNDELRDPTETEVLMLDTYWSDHCRHTTFETVLENVIFSKDRFNKEIEKAFNTYLNLRDKVSKNKKPITLMDMATISGKYERLVGNLDDLEISDEINACSIYIDVLHDDKIEKWLLMFKNETHNHPTEIEPFGGASTCVGGAIRDPLSGRSYVYQAMRVTGSANPTEDISHTTFGKLPQRKISKGAALGYSSYGNQIGLATSHVREIIHEGYRAKRMEVGAVVGAVPLNYVRREKPMPGDKIILIGGKTGRDGVGGATGSSKEHTEESIETSSAEVQKGNAPEERKIQRLFRNKEVTKLIKKSNDFGAGGVSVAIGELADGLVIDLNKVPTKYKGLNGTELAISESQERMAVVVEDKDASKFIELAHIENIEASIVASVTGDNRLIMYWNNVKIVDLSRDFINTNGVRQKTNVFVNEINERSPIFRKIDGESLKDKIINNLSDLNNVSQQGMVEMFDSTIGSGTVLMPYGGKYQLTESQASAHKIPVLNGETKTCSVLTYGYDPYISKWSPFHGACYAILESISKVVSVGCDYKNIRFTFQEYFEKLGNDDSKWGKPFSALLGAIFMQNGFSLPAIGGKDSMSGTFKDINVPPTLISFAINTCNTDDIVSNELKGNDNYIYLIKHNMTNTYLPNINELKENYDFILENMKQNNIISAFPVNYGGISDALIKMALGNKIGFNIDTDLPLFKSEYGSIIVESKYELSYKNAILLGETTLNDMRINNEVFKHDEVIELWNNVYEDTYPVLTDKLEHKLEIRDFSTEKKYKGKSVDDVLVFIPVFPGTNCDYDTVRAFEEAGASTSLFVFKNKTEKDIKESINEMKKHIEKANIIALSGGFSAGDEPDGSGKFIANVLKNNVIKEAIEEFLENDGLMVGICNGFQALVKSGLLPFKDLGSVSSDNPTLTKNNINRHVSKIISTRVSSNNSPWLSSFKVGDIHNIAISHGEGKFVAPFHVIDELVKNGQVAFQYCDYEGNPTMNGKFNPNGSMYAIEGIVSKCGRILGKMGHSERKGDNVYKNIPNVQIQDIFKNAVNYFK